VGIFFKESELFFQSGWQGNIVPIHAGDEGRLAKCETEVESKRKALIPGRSNDLDTRIIAGDLLDYLQCPVCRAVVDYHYLDVGVGLRLDAGQRFGNIGFDVVDRHQYADSGHAYPF
jgi:hypothetical protein